MVVVRTLCLTRVFVHTRQPHAANSGQQATSSRASAPPRPGPDDGGPGLHLCTGPKKKDSRYVSKSEVHFHKEKVKFVQGPLGLTMTTYPLSSKAWRRIREQIAFSRASRATQTPKKRLHIPRYVETKQISSANCASMPEAVSQRNPIFLYSCGEADTNSDWRDQGHVEIMSRTRVSTALGKSKFPVLPRNSGPESTFKRET